MLNKTVFRACIALLVTGIAIAACKRTHQDKDKGTSISTPPKDSVQVYSFVTEPSKTVLTDSKDTLLYSFVTVGCNRVEKEDVSEEDKSTANLNQLRQTFLEVSQMNPVPDYFIFTGDLVLGYVKFDTEKLEKELKAWRKIYEASPMARTRTKMVALPGNHELLISKKTSAGVAEENIWQQVMAPYIAGNNGPKRGGKDSLDTDESRLDYSFDYKGSHFVMLNTDAVGQECKGPVYWLDEDLKAAQAKNPKHTFVFSHIPAYGAPKMNGPIEQLDNNYAFWDVLEKHRVDAMFSAHNHVYCRLQPHKGKTTMLIAGNGGSKLNANCTDAQKFYGYTLVKVYKSGKVLCYSYGRPVPAAGYNAPVEGITTVRDSAEITFRN